LEIGAAAPAEITAREAFSKAKFWMNKECSLRIVIGQKTAERPAAAACVLSLILPRYRI
jgi:hypothetical protein